MASPESTSLSSCGFILASLSFNLASGVSRPVPGKGQTPVTLARTVTDDHTRGQLFLPAPATKVPINMNETKETQGF